MVTARYKRRSWGTSRVTEFVVRVDGLVNRGGWFGETYLVEIGMGFGSSFFVVEAGSEQDAIDEFADSRYSHLIDIEDEDACDACQVEDWDNCECDFAGNDGHRVNLENVWVSRCKVNYFAPKDTELGVIYKENGR